MVLVCAGSGKVLIDTQDAYVVNANTNSGNCSFLNVFFQFSFGR
jgi:hypothetical protein